MSSNTEAALSADRHHTLKILPEFYEDVRVGRKTFEVRKADRTFQRGDILILREHSQMQRQDMSPNISVYVDNSRPPLRRRITYVLHGGQFGIDPGYCVLGMEELSDE